MNKIYTENLNESWDEAKRKDENSPDFFIEKDKMVWQDKPKSTPIEKEEKLPGACF